ncbi:MAG TPA: DUF3098 domain-containing protein [Candidatus Kapabacteria bacterium]|nr:DUF3098 domain-containing protein [Candidatus Kapabacteria bacterium]
MAKTDRRREVNIAKKQSSVKWEFPLGKNNLMIIGAGLAVIALGYILMATGITNEPALPDGTWNNSMAVTVAPILLIIGYTVIIPFGIIKRFTKKEVE